ncbi:MAG: Pr6Pr family membrane protein [Firmicutes bacterium]|nr:Pr6Pr family membrane protein [Bacillota bacterium]
MNNLLSLRKNRIFALCFRVIAFSVCLFGILWRIGIFFGYFHGVIFLYFTLQTNIAVTVLFGYLIVKTAISLKKEGINGCNEFNPRISVAIMIAITFVLIGFWMVLAPAGAREFPDRTYLLGSFDNLSVHLIAPLLMLADYAMFSKGGQLKGRDPFLFLIIPVLYTISVMILGATRTVVFYTPGLTYPSYFPYFFMDFNEIGLLMIPFMVAMTAFYLGLGLFLRFIDKKRVRKKKEKSDEETEITEECISPLQE